MSRTEEQFERLLDLLESVMSRMGAMHSAPRDFGTGVNLHRAEIHTVHAIGEVPGGNVTRLAEHMGVTKGAVSQIVSKLVSKGLVKKSSAPDNAKEVLLDLTALGRRGFENHQRFHMKMFDVVREHFGEKLETRLDETIKVMEDFVRVLDLYEKHGLAR